MTNLEELLGYRTETQLLDKIGPGIEAIPAKGDSPDEARSAKGGPRSTMGKPGMRGGFKPRNR